jgi:hypothetical protein
VNPVTDDVQRVARAMLKDFDAIMSEVSDQVWQHVPAYSSILLERDDLSDRVQGNILNVIMCVLEDRPPSKAELARSAQNGERRALQGVSQASIIQSFRWAERVLGETFQTWCARMQVKPASARTGRTTMIGHLDRLEQAMLESFGAMQKQITTQNALTEPTLMNRLATGASIAPAEVAQLAGVLGVEGVDDTRFVGIAAIMTDRVDDTELQRVRHHLVFQLRAATGGTVLSGNVQTDSDLHVAVFALAWERPTAELAPLVTAAIGTALLRHPVRAAVGESRTGLVQVGASCRQAIQTIEATRTTAVERETVLYRDSLLEIIARRDPAITRELHERYIGPLAGHEFLEETLRSYIANDLSLGDTAEQLHVHKNTIGYRVRRIQEITGLDLHVVRDLARIVLALEGSPQGR